MIASQNQSQGNLAEVPHNPIGLAPPSADLATLVNDLRHLIVKVANLPHIKPESIGLDQPLYRDGLGLDSIDILELVVNIERNYGLKVRNDDAGRLALRDLGSLADATFKHLSEQSPCVMPQGG